MDADLQHPPQLLSRMFQGIMSGADIVVPSRFIPGGEDGGLNLLRKLISWTARAIGRMTIKKLRGFSDITGGYFMFRKSLLDGVALDPTGWKILIEILVRCECKNVVEIPYKFSKRYKGESKMSVKEQINYLKHLVRLAKVVPNNKQCDILIKRWTDKETEDCV